MGQEKIKVMIVDDSALIRHLLTEIINAQPDMVCIGAAPDPLVARQMIKSLNPDVLTLDIEMPKMDGLDFLEKIMRLRPMPILMISTLTEKGSEIALKALELGAIDFVSKPKFNVKESFVEYQEEIASKIRVASKVKFSTFPEIVERQVTSFSTRHSVQEKLIILGASTGGTEAIKTFLIAMPKECPAILIVQHMPAAFTKSFAHRLDGLCDIKVTEAVDGEKIVSGQAYIAPGGLQFTVNRVHEEYRCVVRNNPSVNRHCPSVDVLFHSAAENVGANAVGVMMTGMGKDGAEGMLAMRKAGAYNIAQNEATCVVYGMPREAVALGGVHESLPLKDIANRVLEYIHKVPT